MLLLFLFLLLQSSGPLSPTIVAVVTAIFTVAVGGVGMAVLRDRVNADSRIKGLLASLMAAYGMVAPFISSFPRWLGMVLAVIGLVLTLFSGRLHGPPGRLQGPPDAEF